MSGEPTYVYFIRPVGMDGPIKIGCSGKPLKRLITFAAWSPFPLEIIGYVSGDFSDEAFLHRHFSDLHLRREWFMSSPVLRETIERILAGATIEDACRSLEIKKSIRNQKRPVKTEDRKLFLSYGNRLRAAIRPLWGKAGRYFGPPDVRAIMHNWRCDRTHNHLPIPPTPEQLSRLEEVIADPRTHCVFYGWADSFPTEQDRIGAAS